MERAAQRGKERPTLGAPVTRVLQWSPLPSPLELAHYSNRVTHAVLPSACGTSESLVLRPEQKERRA